MGSRRRKKGGGIRKVKGRGERLKEEKGTRMEEDGGMRKEQGRGERVNEKLMRQREKIQDGGEYKYISREKEGGQGWGTDEEGKVS